MIHRLIISTKRDVDYYVPVDVVNVADEIHVTGPNPSNMRGYGGSTLRFDMDDGTHELVKGPWHTNATDMYKDTEILVTDLHLTQVTLFDETTDEVIYDEDKPVLGTFYRGYRAAQQLAVIRDKPIRCYSQSNGGSSISVVYPDKRHQHPLSKRKGE